MMMFSVKVTALAYSIIRQVLIDFSVQLVELFESINADKFMGVDRVLLRAPCEHFLDCFDS